jgi:hypothetical protein
MLAASSFDKNGKSKQKYEDINFGLFSDSLQTAKDISRTDNKG